jgi:hypothetical protein
MDQNQIRRRLVRLHLSTRRYSSSSPLTSSVCLPDAIRGYESNTHKWSISASEQFSAVGVRVRVTTCYPAGLLEGKPIKFLDRKGSLNGPSTYWFDPVDRSSFCSASAPIFASICPTCLNLFFYPVISQGFAKENDIINVILFLQNKIKWRVPNEFLIVF